MNTVADRNALACREFDAVRPRISEVFEAYLKTPSGRNRNWHGPAQPPSTYAEMAEYAPIFPESLEEKDLSGLVLGTDGLEEYLTTGTKGTPRSIYLPAGGTADVSWLLQKAGNASRITAAHTVAVIDSDVFVKSHLEGLRRASAPVSIRSYADPTDVATIVRQSDAVILVDYPSALARFVHLTGHAVETGLLSPEDVAETGLVARLTGEPMTGTDLTAWYDRAQRLGYLPVIEMSYGSTELLRIGGSQFVPDKPTVEYLLDGQNCFAEVLDLASLRPLSQGTGILCGTSYRTSGTVLYRYILGDEVDIFERDGRRYVTNIRRPDALTVAGRTVSLTDFVARVREETGLQICIEVRKSIDAEDGIQSIDIIVLIPSAKSEDNDRVRVCVGERLVDQLHIRPEVASGLVVVQVNTRPLGSQRERRPKAWKLTTQPAG